MVPTARRLATCAATVIMLVAGCGVPTGSDSFESIDAEVPPRLADTLPPPTTTTTTTVPDAPDSTVATTVPAPPPTMVPIFFLSRGELVAIDTPVDAQVRAPDLITLLENGPGSDVRDNLVVPGLISEVSSNGGIVTIDLDEDTYRDIPSRDQRLAIGQMVLTFLVNLPAVGFALFTVDGEPTEVPKGNRLFTQNPVNVDDYAELEVDAQTTIDTAGTDPPAITTPGTDEVPPVSAPPDSSVAGQP